MATPTGYVTITDGDGNVLDTVEVIDGVATYQKVLTEEDVGVKTIEAYYTGDNSFDSGPLDTFTVHVSDANGENSTRGQYKNVTQIIAGPGIYISPNNGKGVVTISTKPFGATDQTLYEVVWGPGQSQFIAVGQKGATSFSSDGANWSSTEGPGINVQFAVANEPDSDTYYALGQAGKIYKGDSTGYLETINTGITESFLSNEIIQHAGSDTGGGGGGGINTASWTVYLPQTYIVGPNDQVGDGLTLSVATPYNSEDYFAWHWQLSYPSPGYNDLLGDNNGNVGNVFPNVKIFINDVQVFEQTTVNIQYYNITNTLWQFNAVTAFGAGLTLSGTVNGSPTTITLDPGSYTTRIEFWTDQYYGDTLIESKTSSFTVVENV